MISYSLLLTQEVVRRQCASFEITEIMRSIIVYHNYTIKCVLLSLIGDIGNIIFVYELSK